MPELPEVEIITQGIQSLTNQVITDVIVHQPKLRYPINPNLNKSLINNKITQITRRAKYIIMHLESKEYLIWHLGMSGSITTFVNNSTDQSVVPLKKHDHVEIIFKNITLRYNDPRRFGCLILSKSIINQPLLINLGSEPLTDEFDAIYLLNQLKNKKSTIKQLIMHNQIVVGVGNIYAPEALFMAKISPLRQGLSITNHEAALLVSCIKSVLNTAIQLGGSSLRDYKHADGNLGYFQNSHKVYGKANKPCSICNSIILDVRLGQRNSFYCPKCQL